MTVRDYYTRLIKKSQFKKDPSMAGNYNGREESIENDYSLKYYQKLNDKFEFFILGEY